VEPRAGLDFLVQRYGCFSLAQQFLSHLACGGGVAIPTTQSRLCSPNVIMAKENSATKQVAFKLKISMAQTILVTKLKQRNLGVKENCALKKLYGRVWTEIMWLRVQSDSGFMSNGNENLRYVKGRNIYNP
jgi:hypothetical protein